MRKRNVFVFSILIFVSLLVFLFFHGPALKIDNFVTQVFYILNKDSVRAEEIVVVEIDDATLSQIKEQWPFRRAQYAKALNILNEGKPKVVGFDIVFSGEGFSFQDDEAFTQALKDFKGQVVLAYFFTKHKTPIYPELEFRKNAITGFINVATDKDGVVRRARSYFSSADFFDFSWAVKISSAFLGATPKEANNYILLNKKKIPLQRAGISHINYFLAPEDITTISFKDLTSRNFPSDLFFNKIVLISPTLDIAHDIHSTPLGSIPGIFIQANVIADILRGKFLQSVPFVVDLAIFALTLVFMIFVLRGFTFLRRIFISLGALIFLFWLAIILRSYGWIFCYGRVAVGSLSFIILGNIYTYSDFLVAISKIKNKTMLDPLTKLYNLRYFFERLNFELRSISRKKVYLLIIKLEGFQFLSRGANIETLRGLWAELDSFLFSLSKLWARYGPEVIVGELRSVSDASKLKNWLGAFAVRKKIKAKLGYIQITPKINVENSLVFLIEKLEASQEDIVEFRSDDPGLSLQKKKKSEDFLSGLYSDTEEKNRELLATISNLKTEEKKTIEAYIALMESLVVALESKDHYTQGHTKRVSEYALKLVDKLGLSAEEKDIVRKGAILHDLGKIGIPDAILHKKSGLTDEEFEVIKSHEILSAKILEPIKDFKEVIPCVLYHHESFDGTGYPDGIAGELIPLGARIIAVADIFDALTTGRDYKKAFSIKEAVAELRNIKGKKLDPVLVDKFIEVLKETQVFSE